MGFGAQQVGMLEYQKKHSMQIDNFTIKAITREDGVVTVEYSYTRSYDGGIGEDGKERGQIERIFEASTIFSEYDKRGEKIDDKTFVALIKERLGVE